MNMTGDSKQSGRPSLTGTSCSYIIPGDWNTFSPSNTYIQGNDTSPLSESVSTPINNYLFYSNFGPLPSAISFPIPLNQENEMIHRPTPLRCKRKTDSPIPVAVKQHITEERMAEHLSKLHISSEVPAPTTEPESNDCKERRLYMCEEMRKLQTDPIIPPSLLERMNSPCKALVLWTPPRRPVFVNETEDDNNNNEEEIPDNNFMDMDR